LDLEACGYSKLSNFYMDNWACKLAGIPKGYSKHMQHEPTKRGWELQYLPGPVRLVAEQSSYIDSEAGEGIKHLPGLGGRGRLPAGLQNSWYGLHRQFCHALSENGIMSYDSIDYQ
jgi:hypothetical protein